MAFLRTIVRSIQRGSVTVPDLSTTATASITAVSSTARAELAHLGQYGLGGNNGNVANALVGLTLENTTTIRGTRGGSSSNQTTLFQVTEWY